MAWPPSWMATRQSQQPRPGRGLGTRVGIGPKQKQALENRPAVDSARHEATGAAGWFAPDG